MLFGTTKTSARTILVIKTFVEPVHKNVRVPGPVDVNGDGDTYCCQLVVVFVIVAIVTPLYATVTEVGGVLPVPAV
jgi:hypothetical protein